MKNLKTGVISSSGQKQGENTKIGKFPRKSGRLGSYAIKLPRTPLHQNRFAPPVSRKLVNLQEMRNLYQQYQWSIIFFFIYKEYAIEHVTSDGEKRFKNLTDLLNSTHVEKQFSYTAKKDH